jgi:glycerol-3-phosphate acyltransferase PlsY
LLVVGAYLLGSICFGIVWARRAGIDLRSIGSGNVGATNVERALGRSAGRWVMALDAAKGAVPVLAGRALEGGVGAYAAAAGVAAVVGHVFPIYFAFRGGKGAATAAGVLAAAAPAIGLLALASFVVGRVASKRASVGSLLGVGAALVAVLILEWNTPTMWMALGCAFVVVLRHADNIARLRRGEEPPA